jgi:HEAT repeat protein
MQTAYTKCTTEDLVSAFANAAYERGQALLAADPRKANARSKTMAKIYVEIKERGSNALRPLLSLLNHNDAFVRLWAAVYALEFDPRPAVPVLENIFEKETGLLRFISRKTLETWREGKFHLTLPSKT